MTLDLLVLSRRKKAQNQIVRTDQDEYTPHHRYRIYSRDLLLYSEHSVLHSTGTWYVEPSNWTEPQPRQRGYDTYRQAREEAEAIESFWLNAEIQWAKEIPLPASNKETVSARTVDEIDDREKAAGIKEELEALIAQAKAKSMGI